MSLRFTLLSDGPSDRALISHLTWLLKTNGVKQEIRSEWAELRHLRQVPQGLEDRIIKATELYPCDLLFVHRDSERESLEARKLEVVAVLERLDEQLDLPVVVCVIPVRMQEAWLLFDQGAIRRAAGNPNGRVRLELPKLRTIENLPDPKVVLHDLLRLASERTGRRLRQFNVSHSASQVSQHIGDFSPLSDLSAFQTLNRQIRRVVGESNWTDA